MDSMHHSPPLLPAHSQPSYLPVNMITGDSFYSSQMDPAPALSGGPSLDHSHPVPMNSNQFDYLGCEPEQRVLQEVIALSQAIDKAPISRLAPLASQIERLSTHYRRISRHIRACSAESDASKPVVSEKDRKQAAVEKLLTSTTGLIDEIQTAAVQFQKSPAANFEDMHQDKHIQSILQFQKRKFSGCSAAGEKILLICACKSLAKDFRNFEIQSGMDSKQDQLTTRILQGRDPGVQTISKNLQNFLSGGDGTSSALRSKLDAALRFGIKLEVADALGASLGLGSILSLLFGCECVGFSKLPYTSFSSLQQTLSQNPNMLEPVRKFADQLEPWWKQFSESYHLRFATQQAMFLDQQQQNLKVEDMSSPSSVSLGSLSPPMQQLQSTMTMQQPTPSLSPPMPPMNQDLLNGSGSYNSLMMPPISSGVITPGLSALMQSDYGFNDWDFNQFDSMMPLHLPANTQVNCA